jgi:hypothetical protein
MTTQHDDDELEALLAQLLALKREGDALVLWHRTASASVILTGGWRDGGDAEGQRAALANPELGTGVYLSNRPLDSNEGAKGDQLLRIVLALTEQDIAAYEVIEESGESTYREWCIPAAVLNANGRTIEAEEIEE